MRNQVTALAAACLLSGCAVMPNYVSAQAEHDSHVTQHRPFTSTPSNVGSELIGISAEWSKPGGGWFLNITESLDVDPCRAGWCGEIYGPPEEFRATVGYRLHVHECRRADGI
jgi:hypothetical protein